MTRRGPTRRAAPARWSADGVRPRGARATNLRSGHPSGNEFPLEGQGCWPICGSRPQGRRIRTVGPSTRPARRLPRRGARASERRSGPGDLPSGPRWDILKSWCVMDAAPAHRRTGSAGSARRQETTGDPAVAAGRRPDRRGGERPADAAMGHARSAEGCDRPGLARGRRFRRGRGRASRVGPVGRTGGAGRRRAGRGAMRRGRRVRGNADH